MFSKSPSRSTVACLAAILFVCTGAVFSSTCWNGFVYDDGIVIDNPHVQDGLRPGSILQGLGWAFTTLTYASWHPLTWISWQIDAQLFGLRPWGYHLTNILLHAANTALLFLLLHRLTGAVWRSALVAALFALHPLHVETVAWIAERKGLLSTSFTLLTLWAYAAYAHRPHLVRYSLVVVCFACALMSKSMVVTIPAVLLLFDYWPLRRLSLPVLSPGAFPHDRQEDVLSVKKESFGWLLLEKLPLFALAVGASALTAIAQEADRNYYQFEWPDSLGRWESALVSYAIYLGKTLWPVHLAAFYPFRLDHFPAWQLIAAAALLLGATALALNAAPRRPYLAVGWIWYLGTLVPVIGLVPVQGGHALADRYTYLPLIGIFLAVSWSLADAVRAGWLPQRAAVVGSALVLGACTALTCLQTTYWHDETALWTHALKVTTNNHRAHYNLGYELIKQRKYDLAIAQFQRAIALRPGYYMAQTNLASALAEQRRYAEAAQHFEAALRSNPRIYLAEQGWAKVLFLQGKPEEALQHYAAALTIEPNSAADHYSCGLILLQLGRTKEACRQFSAALETNPQMARAHNALGVALLLQGEKEQSWSELMSAARLQPDDAKLTLDLAHASMGRTGVNSNDLFERARRLNPHVLEETNNRAWAFATSPHAQQRNGKLAVLLAQEICEATGFAEPSFLDTLAAAYAENGQFAEAQNTARQALAHLPSTVSKEDRAAIELRVRGYEARQPYRQIGTSGGVPKPG